jgi:hypothetical protein
MAWAIGLLLKLNVKKKTLRLVFETFEVLALN